MPEIPSSLVQQVRTLPAPKEFFRKLPVARTRIPENVLVFPKCQAIPASYSWVHHRFVMVIALDGQGGVFCDEKMVRVDPGKGILIFPFQYHYFAKFVTRRILWLFLTFDFVEQEVIAALRQRPFALSDPDWYKVAAIASSYRRSLDNDPVATEEVQLWLRLLLLSLCKSAGRCPAAVSPMSAYQKIVQKMTRFVVQNAVRPIRPCEVARAVAASESQLRRICLQTLGISLGRFIRCTRLNKACAFLHSSEHNVTEVAEACGFSSLFAFSRTFKSEIGVSPHKYRQRFRET